MREKKPSVVTPRRVGRGTRFLATTAALAVGAFGGLVAIAASSASATVTTGDYTIGTPTGAVTGAAVTPTSVVEDQSTSYTVSFTTPASLGTDAYVYIADDDGNAIADTATDAYLVSGTCLQTGTASTSSSYGLEIEITCSSGIAAGSTVDVTFDAGNTTVPTANFYFEVSTSSNSTVDDTNTVAVTSTPPTLSASTASNGAGAVYSLDDIGASGATGGTWGTLTASATVIELSSVPPGTSLTSNASAITWDQQPGDYTVTYTPPSGSATSDSVDAVDYTTTSGAVYLGLAAAIPQGSTVDVTADGINPTTAGSSVKVNVTPGTATSVYAPGTGFTDVQSNGVGYETSGSVTFGSPVTSPELSASTLAAGAAATYTVTFLSTAAVSGGTGNIAISETTGPTNFSTVTGVLVSDATAGWHFVTTSAGTAAGDYSGTSGGDLTVYLPAGDNLGTSDYVTVEIINATNPGAGTYSDFDVSTSGNPVSAAVPTYTIGATGVAAPTVTVSPNTLGSVATYTISGLYATAALSASSTSYEIELTAPSGTVFPDQSTDYTISDATTTSGSGTMILEDYVGPNNVILEVPNAINSGDALTISVADVVNPSTSSSTDTITLTGDVGESTTAAFPTAAMSYPNGSLVNFSGTIYDFGGGHAFGIPSLKVLAALQKVDPATVLKAPSGATVPTAKVRAGTIVTAAAVTGSPTIYVMGTDGDLHGFSTPAQLVSDGYDTALNVSVPNLAGLTVGTTAGVAGSAVTAAATTADGAIVNSSGTIYVFAGGRAFGVPTPKAMAAIKVTDKATSLSGSVTTTLTGATLANGVLLSISGEVYVTYQGYAWPFKTMTQLKTDGYGGTAAVPVHALEGVSAVTSYTGS